VIRARSGQLVVIGGLMAYDGADDRAGIPLLGRIPYAGLLFRQQRTANSKRELVILLRATVIGSDGFTEPLRSIADRLRELSPGAESLMYDGIEAQRLRPLP
jgi:MSHA biogenesis protein MshL